MLPQASLPIHFSAYGERAGVDSFVAASQKAELERAAQAKDQLEANRSEFVKAAKATEESYQSKYLELERSASETITKNDAELTRLTTHLAALEDVIREKIELATNYQLFHSFQTRQHAIEKSKNFWAKALGLCVTLSAAISIVFICYLPYVKVYNAAFYMKLSISSPIIYAITFCSLQFSRERRLEEEYAFKANISISLDPYRKLVAELVDKGNPAEVTKYADFVIESINKVFTSPTAHSFDENASNSDILTGVLKEVGNIVAPLANARLRWLKARERELLPTRYVHAVFTLPRELAPLALQNKRPIYNLLFHASAETLLEVARDPRHLGAEIGFFSVLHTWNRRLQFHPHVHCVLAAGGIAPDHSGWISARRSFFLPIGVLKR